MLYSGHTDIWGMAEDETFLVAYPDGEVVDPDRPNRHYWARDELNIPYVQEHVISYALANYNVNPGRIYLVGFSGGAKLTFKIASDPQVSPMIAGFGTVAGDLADGNTCETIDVIDPRLRGGRPLPAFLVQGARDPKQPLEGGYDNQGKLDISFADKVDRWVNHLHHPRLRHTVGFPASHSPLEGMGRAQDASSPTKFQRFHPGDAERMRPFHRQPFSNASQPSPPSLPTKPNRWLGAGVV
jgi:poly(3-hydroxybutyrate) depolymerase